MNGDSASDGSAPRLAGGPRFHLSLMMFLEFAIWGAWFVLLSNYLGKTMGFENIGRYYATMAIGAVVSPIFVGQIADRYFSSERLLAVLHLGGGIMLVWLAQIDDPDTFYWVLLGYALFYNPTLALTNSIAFAHVPNATRDFPGIRVLGTIGWIVVNLAYLLIVDPNEPISNIPFYLAAGFSFVFAVYSFFLPRTPPAGKAGEAFPFLHAIGLMREPAFAVFFSCSFLITIALAFYYNYVGIFLQTGAGVEANNVAPLTTIGQFAEMILLPLLPWFLFRFGMKWVLVLGMLAWGVRYALFSFADDGQPFWIIIVGIALHGICFDFFFAAGFIHVENKAPPKIRASAQALFTFLTYGLGLWIGGECSGLAEEWCRTDDVIDWMRFWLFPGVGCLVALAIFALLFRERGVKAANVAGEALTD